MSSRLDRDHLIVLVELTRRSQQINFDTNTLLLMKLVHIWNIKINLRHDCWQSQVRPRHSRRQKRDRILQGRNRE